MRVAIGEIFRQVDEEPHTDAMIALLRKHDSIPMRTVLRLALDPKMIWNLPAGAPPFNELKQKANTPGALYHEARRLDIFIKGGRGDALPPIKREAIFVQLLEGCDARDVEALLNAKDKKVGKSGRIDIALINEAFPGLISETE